MSTFQSRLDQIAKQLEEETEKRQALERLLDNSMLRDLLKQDLDLVKKVKTNGSPKALTRRSRPQKPQYAVRRNLRTYRHKSEMVGDVVKAQKEYDKVKRKLQDSEAELETLQREAKVASAKASVAKVKIKALLVLMRKMIAFSVNSDRSNANMLFEPEATYSCGAAAPEGVGSMIDAKLNSIASMIPKYNSSLEEVTRLAKDAMGDRSDDASMAEKYDDIWTRRQEMPLGGAREAECGSAPVSVSEYQPAPSADSFPGNTPAAIGQDDHDWENIIARFQNEMQE